MTYHNSINKVYYTSPNKSLVDFVVIADELDQEDKLMDYETFNEMCNTYPSLKKAYEHFTSIYNLVKHDFEERKRNDF